MDGDLYKDLGVSPTASQAELKAAWREASKQHPDLGGDPERFVRAKLAYDFLSDPGRRAKYDAARKGGKGRRASQAKEAFEQAWAAWEASFGDLLPHLQALRGAARGSDWWDLAEASFGLVGHLRAKEKAAPREAGVGDLASKLRQLQAAHAAGLLTDEEYKAKRAALLDSF